MAAFTLGNLPSPEKTADSAWQVADKDTSRDQKIAATTQSRVP
jgi:hypothetical protein